MATLLELARTHTSLRAGGIAHLQRLVATWGMLSDLCFADLLLLAPVAGSSTREHRFVVLGQVRPTTSQTLHRDDLVGHVIHEAERPLVGRAFRTGEIFDGEILVERGEVARTQCIPVRRHDDVLAVMARESVPHVGRRPGELERTYVEVFDRFASMIVAGRFPFETDLPAPGESPRVGDGVLLLDEGGRITYASPNGVSALHRMGIHATTEGATVAELGLSATLVETAFERCTPATEDVQRPGDVTVVARCIPLLEDEGRATGALVLLRDVTDLRRRDRLLLSKDATIREVHHRVKNNLQTISSILRLQGRRTSSDEARDALAEASRRIRSIALVHELLSREPSEQVSFDEIVPPLVRMAEETVVGLDEDVAFSVEGEAGGLPADVATPLAVVLTELLQNAAEHAFPPEGSEPDGGPRVVVRLAPTPGGEELEVEVRDNGVGLPAGFDVDSTSSLGLSIVRSLVTSQLGGRIEMWDDGGTVARICVPTAEPPGDS